ncbi:hypothetical protein LJR098_003006 [Rhizobium sp. LjRoot98]|uniref:hypothetical protein n=1 Tax=unclassified Rhizobium TaxID=2613769 RepID=UPI000B17B913|nr:MULTISPECIES: hypothetical protein [unclassified Rhizobium]
MTSGPIFSDTQLKLWLRRVKTEMSKGTPPEAALDLVKTAMAAQTAGQSRLLPADDPPQKTMKNPRKITASGRFFQDSQPGRTGIPAISIHHDI